MSEAKAENRNHNILLVDDREENIFALESMLAGSNRRFFTALSGNDALRIAFKEDISLILLDVQMPEMDGFETAEFLKSNKRTHKIPIIFVTAISKEDKYVIRGLEEGAIDYLFKPLDTAITRAKVAAWLTYVDQQKELEEKNAELQKLNEDKNKLLGIAAHDLRNPLGNIMLLSDFLMDEMKDIASEDGTEFLNLIKSSSEYMLGLVNNLLDVSKIESGKLTLSKQREDMVSVIKKVISMNRKNAERKSISVSFSPAVPELYMDFDVLQMEQVLNNLLSNAIKFSNASTQVNVRMQKQDNKVRIDVEDHGQGIPEKEMNKLFKFFSRTSVQATAGEQSSGLGLAITRKIVEAHGGSISVSSQEGAGSTFTVEIPV